jgi:hypothetical protein
MEDDILGYWVYIPRYAYQVMRWSALDNTPITTPEAFNIAFQKKDDTKYYPFEIGNHHHPYDYRTGYNEDEWDWAPNLCNQSSNTLPDPQYKDDSCWATHPAFTFGKTELNGIWIGKFETTGTAAEPTIKPNLASLRSQVIGVQFSTAVNMSQNPDGAAGGMNPSGTTYYPVAKDAGANKQNLSNQTQSRMLKNSDWGATTYLATSAYGRGVSEVWNNSNSLYITGCAGSSVSANSEALCNAYDSANGVHASTTDNIYGIYDMSGGSYEYTMANRGAISSTSWISTMPQTRYFDRYYVAPFGTKLITSTSSTEYYYNYDICAFPTCGGQANYETTTPQSISTSSQSWFSDYSNFTSSSNPWSHRGGFYGNDSNAGIFASDDGDGDGSTRASYRVVLNNF